MGRRGADTGTIDLFAAERAVAVFCLTSGCFAAFWLDLIRPVWFETLRTKKRKPLLLADVRKDLLADKPWLIGKIRQHFEQFPILPDPETRIRACIFGVPSPSAP